MTSNFVEDEKIQQIAEAYSLDAVDFLRQHFGIALDWTDSSVLKIEDTLRIFHRERAKAKPSDEQVWNFSKMFGSYIGEVYRKNHGATWGVVTLQGETFPGMQARNGNALFWPWARVRNRLLNGPEDNVWHYYQSLQSGAS